MTDGPLIVQSDKTLLLDIDHPMSVECRRAIAPFAELERSPEHIHTYRLTPLGLWNARAAGHDAEQVIDTLIKYSRYAVPHSILNLNLECGLPKISTSPLCTNCKRLFSESYSSNLSCKFTKHNTLA